MEKYAAVILAAGKGTRMNEGLASPIPKVMFEIAGEPIIYWSVKLVADAGIDRVILVVGYKKEMIEQYFGDRVEYAVQEPQLGTGHAVMMAEPLLKNNTDAVIVSYGDCPLYRPETIRKLIQAFESEKPTIAMLSAISADAGSYGRIFRSANGEVESIIEAKDCTPEQLKNGEWNPGFYIFDAHWLLSKLSQLSDDNAQHEYYLTDLIKIAKDQGKKIIALPVSEEVEASGINTQAQLAEAESVLIERRTN